MPSPTPPSNVPLWSGSTSGANVYPDRPLTKKPAETRMGSGKGSPEWWIANIKPGRVLFELSGVGEDVAREALRLAIHKLPFKARFIKREAGEI